MEQTYVEIGIQLQNFRLSVRIPRIKLPFSKPRQLFRNAKLGRTKKSSSSLATQESSEAEDDWIKDFHQRYNPVVGQRRGRSRTDDDDQSFLAVFTPPATAQTSTPLNLKIRPLNRLDKSSPAAAADVTGFKIYEDEEFYGGIADVTIGGGGSGRKIYEDIEEEIREKLLLDSLNCGDRSYEFVRVEGTVLHPHLGDTDPPHIFRPRSLKFSKQ